MKRSSTWFALILIASALLLSAAQSVLPRPSVQSQMRLTHKRNDQSEQAQADAQPAPSSNISQSVQSTKTISSQSATQQIGDNRSNSKFPICRMIQVWLAGI